MYFTFEVIYSHQCEDCICLFFIQDYIQTLSILVRGSIKEKLQWIFRFYDIYDDGKLTKQVNDISIRFVEN